MELSGQKWTTWHIRCDIAKFKQKYMPQRSDLLNKFEIFQKYLKLWIN